jgi:hypothetical protein
MIMRLVRASVSVVLMFLVQGGLFLAVAQKSTSQISGTITDPSGGVEPGATIEVVNTDTQAERTVTSGASGSYILSLLPPGNYQLVISKQGFQTKTISGIQLEVNQGLTLNEQLLIGGTSQTVTVSAQSELLQASDSVLGTVIAGETVNALPLNGRNFTQLLTLTPGATPISTSQGANLGTDDGSTVAIPGSSAQNPSINGQQNRETLYLLDGVVNTDFRTTTYTILPIIDGISQFKVQSHDDDPAFGSVLGGVVNLVTKSGTNQFHGSGWEFARNAIFDARNSFTDFNGSGAAAPPAPFSQNEFGGAVGGPVWIPKVYNGRNKTFFFFAYEGWRYSQSSNRLYNVPTQAEVNGDFSHSIGFTQIYDPSTTTVNAGGTGYTRQAFPGGVIPANRIDPATQSYIKSYFDQPNLSGSSYNEQLTASETNNNNNYQGRIDQVVTNHDTIFFRWNNMFVNQSLPTTNSVQSVTSFDGLNLGGGITHVFRPNLLLSVAGGRASRAFVFNSTPKAGFGPLSDAGFPGLSTYGPLDVSLSSPYGDAGLSSTQLRRNSSWSVSSTLNWQLGRHSLTFGEFYLTQYRSSHGSGQNLSFANDQTANPDNEGTTGNSLASALLGYPSSGSFDLNNTIKYNIPTWAVYAGDSWKMTPRLTINLGLRYDHLNQPNLSAGLNSGFNFDTGNYEIGGGKLPPACIVSGSAPCIPGSSTDAQTNLDVTLGNDGSVAGSHIILAPNPTYAPHPVWTLWGPRFGFAYQAAPTTVVRGGFGIVYDTLNGWNQTFQNGIGSWPSSASVYNNYNQTGAPLVNVVNALTTVGTPLTTGSPFTQYNYYSSQNNKPTYSEQFNLQVEQTLNQQTVLKLGYVGSTTHRTDYSGVANGATTPGPGTVDQVNGRRPYPYESTFEWDQFTGNASYNALQAELEHRYTNGLQFLVSYTWSKSIDLGGSGLYGAENGPGGGSAVQNFYDPGSNRSVSAYYQPHFVSVSALYALPFGKGKHYLTSGVASQILCNWQINTVAQLASGQVYTMQVPGDIANIGISGGGYGRPNLVGNPTPAKPTKNEWFNPAAFSTPQFSYGNVGRDSMRSSATYDDDVSVFRTFPFTESVSLQFRAEAFNVFNIINYGVPDSNLGDSTAGVVSSLVGTPRQLQFAVKLTF